MELSIISNGKLLLRTLVVAVGTGTLYACGGPSVELPEIPHLETDAFTPHIHHQILAARETVAQRPNNAAANGRLGMTLHAYLLYDASEICFRRARALNRESFRWTYFHADALAMLGRSDAAIAALQDSIELDPGYTAAQARLAGLLVSAGEYEKSEILLMQVLDEHPNFAEAQYELGRLRLRAGRLEEGVALMRQSLDGSGPNAGAYFAIADAYRQLGQTDLAAEFFELHDKYQLQSPQKYDPLLEEIAQLDKSGTAMVNRAKRAYSNGKFTESIAMLTEALAREPENIAARTALVGIYAETKEFDKADEHFEKALPLGSTPAQLYVNLAVARIAAYRWVEAAELLESALSIDPHNALILTRLGSVHNTLGEPEAAMAQFRLALKNDPNLLAAREGLAHALVASGRDDEAVALLADSRVRDGAASMRALLIVATAYENLGDLDKAIAALEQAYSAVSNDSGNTMKYTIQTRLRQLSTRASAQKETD